MSLPTLEETIKKRAEALLERDIKEASENFKNFLSSQKGLFRTGISLCLLVDDQKTYPYLTQLLSCEYIKKEITKHCLAEYIQREIDAIINPKEEKTD